MEVLTRQRADDEGFYVPMELPRLSREEISRFAMKNPNQALAEILNLFFGCELNRWDVDFAAGRYPIRLTGMVRRITVTELWHNPDWHFDRTARDLCARIQGSGGVDEAGDWAYIAVAIGGLFGVFGEMMRDGTADMDSPVDIGVPSLDFRLVMACCYAREMGLPIGTIVICCNENDNLWNLIRQGQLRTNLPSVQTELTECDGCFPEDLERLAHLYGGEAEALKFARCVREGRSYFPDDPVLEQFRKGIYVSVVGRSRVESTIGAIFTNHNYVFGPYSALCHGGLMDYRSRSGAGTHALLLSHRGALCDDRYVARQLNMAVSALHNML